jgi:capsular exopolysaccharide synthesis family protein
VTRELAAAPSGSSQRAEALAERDALKTQIALLRGQLVQIGTVNVNPGQVVATADLPTGPSSPNMAANVALGFLVGLFAGLVGAFVRDRLDKKIRSREDVERLVRAPLIGLIPSVRLPPRYGGGLFTLAASSTSAAEAFRALRTSLLAMGEQHGVRVILVTSATAAEGKSTLAANLSVVLAQADRRVLLISADMRRPRLQDLFELSNRVGLASVLDRRLPRGEATQQTMVKGLEVMLSGPLPARPAELAQSDEMRELLEQTRNDYDFVVLDGTPILPVADALSMSPFVDAVLFVVNARTAKQGAVAQARIGLDHVGAFVLGAVLNQFDPKTAGYGSYGYEERYGPQQTDTVADVPTRQVGRGRPRDDVERGHQAVE